MLSSRWLVPAYLIGFISPAAASDNLGDLARDYVAAHAVVGAVVPSFARQTGLACSACHYQFLMLTPFGRKFKLNGYTLTKQPDLTESDSANGGRLGLTPFSMLSAMVTAGVTHTKDKVPGTQNDVAALPQELSGFLAGRITPKIGVFAQFTYAGPDGAFGIDNIDIRYGDKRTLSGSTEVAYGLTLNNNPTIQDLWNSTPGWGFPFIGSDAAPAPAASAMIDGGLSQNVLGLGSYALFGDLVYAEFDVYRSAFQGVAAPSEADATGAIKGVAPYWRLALQKDMDRQSVMIGTFGMHTSLFPADPGTLSGPRDTYSDIGIDAQFESKVGTGNVVLRGSWIREKQTLDATLAAGLSANKKNTLKALRVNASYYPRQWLGVSGGYFDTRGTTDAIRGKPKTDGFIGEVDLNPWENTRVGLQYTGYSKFDGASGGAASGNNTLFAFVWLAF
jgi:hypothetical protein